MTSVLGIHTQIRLPEDSVMKADVCRSRSAPSVNAIQTLLGHLSLGDSAAASMVDDDP